MSDASTNRLLIVNADDLGLSEGVNRGIVRAHEHGIVTSASLMVRQPAAGQAAAYAWGRPGLSVGLHLDLGEWVYRDGQWQPLYEVVSADDPAAVAEEVSRQFERFVELVGRPPTHVDSHQHAHRSEPLRSAAQALAARLGVPLRHFTPAVKYCGDFYGQGRTGEPLPDRITSEALSAVLRSLPLGVTELACHPGEATNLESVYRNEREAEVAALCDPLVRAVITEQAIELIAFTKFAPGL